MLNIELFLRLLMYDVLYCKNLSQVFWLLSRCLLCKHAFTKFAVCNLGEVFRFSVYKISVFEMETDVLDRRSLYF